MSLLIAFALTSPLRSTAPVTGAFDVPHHFYWGIITLVALPGLPTDISFIHFYDSHEHRSLFTITHGLANLHSNTPSGVSIYLDVTGKLECGQAFLGIQDQTDHQKPFLQWNLGFMKYCAYCHGKTGDAIIASVAFPQRGGFS